MKLLVIGSGGREHAIAWRLAQNPRTQMVYVAPGNAGTALDKNMVNLPITDLIELADFAQKENIYLTVVGPEAPLAAGVVDLFQARNLRIFGPTRTAAQLESSKDYAKRFLVRHGIPTAAYGTFTEASAAHAYIDQQGAPIVIKADGLAAGVFGFAASIGADRRDMHQMGCSGRAGSSGNISGALGMDAGKTAAAPLPENAHQVDHSVGAANSGGHGGRIGNVGGHDDDLSDIAHRLKKNSGFRIAYCDRHDVAACRQTIDQVTADKAGPTEHGYPSTSHCCSCHFPAGVSVAPPRPEATAASKNLSKPRIDQGPASDNAGALYGLLCG